MIFYLFVWCNFGAAAALQIDAGRRRAILVGGSGALLRPLVASASVFEGVYSDPNHPSGYRKVIVDGDGARVVGQDEENGPLWTLRAQIVDDDSSLVLELSNGNVAPQSGVEMQKVDDSLAPTFTGAYSSSPSPSIVWPDGNRWTKKATSSSS